MGGLFSRKKRVAAEKEAQVDEIDQAEWKLGVTRDNLDKYAKTLEKQITSTKVKIREAVKDKKMDRAKNLLRLNKMREKAIEDTLNKKFNCIQQLENIRSAKLTKDYFKSMEQTNAVLKKFTEEYSPEKVEALMEERQEQVDKLEEVGQLLGIPVVPMDDTGLEEELDAYMKTEEPAPEENEEKEPEQEEAGEEKPSGKQKIAALA